MIGLSGVGEIPAAERLAISFFGVRGIGSLFYLAFAVNRGGFPEELKIWSVVGWVIVISIVLHGLLASPVVHALDRRRSGTTS